MNLSIEIKGHAELAAQLAEIAGADLGSRVVVGTNVSYAREVHDGTATRTGRPFLRNALVSQAARVAQIIDGGVWQIVTNGGGSMTPFFLAAGLVVQAEAQSNTPVKTGTLRRSEHTEAFSR